MTGETNAQMIKRLRVEAELRGDCYECRARPAKGWTSGVYVKRCQVCLDRSKARELERRQRPGRCVECGKRWRRRRFKRCVQCRARIQQCVRRRQQARLAIGLCALCSSPLGFTAHGHRSKRYCDHHLEENRIKTSELYAKRRLPPDSRARSTTSV